MELEHKYYPEEQKLVINCIGSIYGSSIENSPILMDQAIRKLLEIRTGVLSLIMAEREEVEYDFEQVELLREIASLIIELFEKRVFSYEKLGPEKCDLHFPERFAFLRDLITRKLSSDPVGAYVELKREIRRQKIKEKNARISHKKCFSYYIENLEGILEKLDSTKMISLVKEKLAGYKIGDRSIYRELFAPTARPNFMLTKYMIQPPKNGIQVDQYDIGTTKVRIYKIPGKVRYTYHIVPPSFTLPEEKYTLISEARRVMAGHKPKFGEYFDPERTRKIMHNIGRDMIKSLARDRGITLSTEDVEELAGILTTYTAGFGVLEALLSDDKIQDIHANAPIGENPLYVYHSDYEECETNLIPTLADAESWATRFRILSGRPLDEANPVLDTQIEVLRGSARVAAITKTLSPYGLAFALRRHRARPWTLPLFIKNKMLSPLAAGLLSFVIDGGRTVLIGGTRSSGKTSLLSACMLEIMRKYRIIISEDTLEIPVDHLRRLGYNIQRLKTRSVITRIETELPAEEGIRAALRLGDSILIVGEVRSTEAKALFEAMRIGAMANVVAGTIHGESAYAIWDRVVHDLGVPSTSFKAIDLIGICNMLKSPDGLHRFRRFVNITEVRKHWTEDPLIEGGFVELMDYDAKEDELVPKNVLLNGDSEILKAIAENVRDWKGDFRAVWDNINLRAETKKALIEFSERYKKPELLEADFVLESNEQFHVISEQVKMELGTIDSSEVYSRWEAWLKERIK